MSRKKSNVSDKASEIAKNIWLAGVGAYGKAADEAQGRLDKAGVETPKLFRDLVKAGTALEEGAKGSLKASTAASKSSVEERINKVRENFNLQRFGRGDELEALQAQVELISSKLDILTNALTASGAIKVPGEPKKAGKKKPLSGKTRTTAKKTVTRKKAPVKKKPVARKK